MVDKIKLKLQKMFDMDVDNDTERIHVQYLVVILTLGFISLFMTGVNIFTHWHKLAYICAAFGGCCIMDAVIESTDRFCNLGRFLFAIEIIALFTIFLVVAEPEGFSVLWMLLLPSCGFFLFRMKAGMVICALQFLIIVLILWTPTGRSILQYPYTDTFIMRFPIVYVAFSSVGILLEFVRLNAQKQVREAKEKYEYLYNHDNLTGLFNRYGFNTTLDKYIQERGGQPFSFAIFDLDRFKSVNDTYGHLNGDLVLIETAKRAHEYFSKDSIVCRWGGEEFSVLIQGGENAEDRCWGLLDLARNSEIHIGDGFTPIKVHFSMGLVNVHEGQDVDASRLVRLADDCMYQAKQNGRNQIVSCEYTPEPQPTEVY